MRESRGKERQTRKKHEKIPQHWQPGGNGWPLVYAWIALEEIVRGS